MAGEGDMEDDDEDDVDFNPYLQRSPSPDRDSGDSSKRVGESEDAEEDGAVDSQEDENLASECVQRMSSGPDQFVGECDGDDKVLEFASDNCEEEEFKDVEQEEKLDDYCFEGGSQSGTYSTTNAFKGKDWEYLEGCLNGIECGVRTSTREDMTAGRNFDGLRKPLNGKDCGISSGSIVYDTQDKPGKDELIGMQSESNLRSDGDEEDMVDAISKRTRAHYSLTDMSLDQLETFLQESDEEEYFQTVDDEEEYRKFLLAVQEVEDPSNEKPEQSSRKGDEDDEEEDVDFEIEIEEALEFDNTSENLRKRRRRKPETREKRRQRSHTLTGGHLLGQSIAPLRQLLPHMGNLTDDPSIMDRRKMRTETANAVWPPNTKIEAPVYGFTAHQIGQLYCLIHEHVQLLVQVYSLCVLEPTRQQMAIDTHSMLTELVEKRELLLSWKKTAFPDFCFRPPYTHPSLLEDGDQATFLHSLTPDISMPTSTSCGQSTSVSSNMSSNVYPGSYFTQGSVTDLGTSSTTYSHNLGQNTAEHSQSYSLCRSLEPGCRLTHHYATIPAHFSQQTAGVSQSLQETTCPLSAWIPSPDQSQRSQAATEEVIASHSSTLQGGLCCSSTGSFVVDPTSVLINPLESAQDLCHACSGGSGGDSTIVTGKYSHSSPVTSLEKGPVQVVSHNHSNGSIPGVVNPDPLPSAMVETATLKEGVQMYRSQAGVRSGPVKSEWAPVISGPIRSLLDVAPLALVRDFLKDVSHVVQEYRQRHLESAAYHIKCERKPLFMTSANDELDQNTGRSVIEGTRSRLFGGGEAGPAFVQLPQIKKTMAAALVESTKKQSLALVPKDTAIAVQRFLPYFSKTFFPHKPPSVATASRLLFTDAEDELLAMGLMMYNTDWKAIQQRFLPSKSMHQIFVRQKNRSSARAPENSIKAVRRMKSSPLTHSEKSSIQDGLGMFKYDWNKVWQYCVPHRDPAILPRQWRIAVGTQKSYKTSDSSKERRRLYEANRRQRIAAKKANEASAVMEEDGLPSCTEASIDGRSCKTGSNGVDDPDNSYIREAFLDDWCPRYTPVVASEPTGTSAEKQQKLISSLSKSKKAKAVLEFNSSTSSPWRDKTTCQSRKQTVKLDPGLPSVKLPPYVQVLSQSQIQLHRPFPLGTRLPPSMSKWVQMTSQGLDKLELSVRATHWQTFPLSNCGTEATTTHNGGSTSQHSMVRFNHSASRRGQTSLKKLPPFTRDSNERTGMTTQGPTQAMHKQSRLAQLPPMEMNQRIALQTSIQASFSTGWEQLPPVDYQLNSKHMPEREAEIVGSKPQVPSTLGQMGKSKAQECAEQGGVKVRRNPAKRSKRLVYDSNKGTAIGKGSFPSLPSMTKGSQQIGPSAVREGVALAIPTTGSKCKGGPMGRSRIKKNQKVQESHVENGSKELHLEQPIIVMEQDELSDSEDDAEAGVEFEHEEMGDSDKDSEAELQNREVN